MNTMFFSRLSPRRFVAGPRVVATSVLVLRAALIAPAPPGFECGPDPTPGDTLGDCPDPSCAP